MLAKDAIMKFIEGAFPHADFVIESVEENKSVLRKAIKSTDLRPGNTVSGPTLMALADAALYIAILGEQGLKTNAVTTNLNISFLRRPVADQDIIAECSLLKVGKQLVTGEVVLRSESMLEPVAFVVGTYSILE